MILQKQICHWEDEKVVKTPSNHAQMRMDGIYYVKVRCEWHATSYWREEHDLPGYEKTFYFALCDRHRLELHKTDNSCTEITEKDYIIEEVMAA